MWKVWDSKILSGKKRSLTEEKFFTLAFPGEGFDKNKLRKLNTALLKLCLEYLAQEALHKNDAHIHTYGLQALNELHHYKHYEHFERAVGKRLESPPISLEKLSARHLKAHEHMVYAKFHHKKHEISHIEEAIRTLNQYYFTYRLYYAFHAYNMEKITGASSPATRIAGLDSYKEQHMDQEDVLSKTMLLLYELSDNEENSKQSFEELRDIFDHKREHLDQALIFSIYSSLLNYCIRKINQEEVAYRKDLMQLHITALKAQLHFMDSFFDYRDFYNMVTNGLVLREFGWAKEIMKEYGGKLHPEHKEVTLEFCEGRMAYYSGDFKPAKKIFAKLTHQQIHEDFFFEINSQQHLLQCCYELEEYVEVEERTNAAIVRLENHQPFNEARRESILNFYSALDRLAQMPFFEKGKLLPLKEEVKNVNLITNRKWLLEKIEERLNSSTI